MTTSEIKDAVLTPYADKDCIHCGGTGEDDGHPCSCRFEKPYVDKANEKGQRLGYLSRRQGEKIVRVA